MKKLLAALLLGLALTGPAFASDAIKAAPDEIVATEVAVIPEPIQIEVPDKPTVALIDKDGNIFCTGFLVTKDLIATAGHCLAYRTALPMRARLTTGYETPVEIAGYTNADQGLDDWGLVKLTQLEAKNWKPAELACLAEQPRVLTRIWTEGYPGANEGALTYTEGYINGRTKPYATWKQPIQYNSMPVGSGHSGGAVYNKDTGLVIGILVGRNTEQKNWSYTQPIKPICDALHKETFNATPSP